MREITGGREKILALPLQPIEVEGPFEQRGLDIIGEIDPNSSKLHKYILIATNYFTKWTEEIPLNKVNNE